MATKKKKISNRKRIFAGTLAAAVIAGASGWWVLKLGNSSIPVPAYRVERVIDGDTFITKEKRHIRLASVSAPEVGECGGEEAKRQLSKFILGKSIYIKVLYNDIYGRLVSLVYTTDGLVNEKMLQVGYAYYNGTSGEPKGISQEATIAKENKIGIFGPKCTQLTNPDNPKCIIKGNKRLRGGNTAMYRFPGCRDYSSTIVQLYLGDRWFCTESEAKKAGFSKGGDCIGKTWPQ